MGIAGHSGFVPNDSNNYDEPDRAQAGANHMFTDYAQDPSVKNNRGEIFRDRRKPNEPGLSVANKRAKRGRRR